MADAPYYKKIYFGEKIMFYPTGVSDALLYNLPKIYVDITMLKQVTQTEGAYAVPLCLAAPLLYLNGEMATRLEEGSFSFLDDAGEPLGRSSPTSANEEPVAFHLAEVMLFHCKNYGQCERILQRHSPATIMNMYGCLLSALKSRLGYLSEFACELCDTLYFFNTTNPLPEGQGLLDDPRVQFLEKLVVKEPLPPLNVGAFYTCMNILNLTFLRDFDVEGKLNQRITLSFVMANLIKLFSMHIKEVVRHRQDLKHDDPLFLIKASRYEPYRVSIALQKLRGTIGKYIFGPDPDWLERKVKSVHKTSSIEQRKAYEEQCIFSERTTEIALFLYLPWAWWIDKRETDILYHTIRHRVGMPHSDCSCFLCRPRN